MQPETHPLQHVIILIWSRQLLLLSTGPVFLGAGEAFPPTLPEKAPFRSATQATAVHQNSELHF